MQLKKTNKQTEMNQNAEMKKEMENKDEDELGKQMNIFLIISHFRLLINQSFLCEFTQFTMTTF